MECGSLLPLFIGLRLRRATRTYEERCSANRRFWQSAAFRLGSAELPQICQETKGLRYTVLFLTELPHRWGARCDVGKNL